MISFKPEVIFNLGNILQITNTFLDTILVDVGLIAGSYFITRKLTEIPSMLQNGLETIIESFYSLTESVADSRAPMIFPFFMTFFLFIIAANWSGLIPGVNTVGFFRNRQFIPLLRSATSDLNVTVGLAIVSAVATHILSIRTIGIKNYLGRFFSINPLNFFIGILEIISEITKVISLSFRLFGNIFAGEVVLTIVSGIFALFFPLPFIFLEIIVGLVQALVFSMLTMVFMAILTEPHSAEDIQIAPVNQTG